MSALRLVFSWMTVLPLRGPADVDRRSAARAIALLPVTGIVLGAGASGLLWLLLQGDLNSALAGLLVVAASALFTRGMHLDGLSDTVDGLGCYGPPGRAQEVMHSGGAGPFGVAALVVSLGAQALAFGELGSDGRWLAIAVAVCAGRVVAVMACRQGVPAASAKGFGALVAGTQLWWTVGAWFAALLVASVWSVPDRPWQGLLVVADVATLSILLIAHVVRRLGGISGDVLGAAIETAVTVTAVGFAFGS